MYKKTRLSVSLKPHETPLPKQGDQVSVGDILIAGKDADVIAHIDIAKLLKIPTSKVISNLVVKDGQVISAGQIIARKSGLVSSKLIKSPVDGIFVILDAEKGIVGIKGKESQVELKAWFDGELIEVDPEKLIFQVTGALTQAKEGKGDPVWGKLVIFTDEMTNLTIPTEELENAIIAVKHAHSELVAKADALGSLAIIAESLEQPPFSLPYLLVDDINALMHYATKMVIVYGNRKELLVLGGHEHHAPKHDREKKKK